MHLQMIPFFPDPAEDRLYHFLGDRLIPQHGKGIGMKAAEPVGKHLFECLFIALRYEADKAEIAQFQIAGLKVPEITKLCNKTCGKGFTLRRWVKKTKNPYYSNNDPISSRAPGSMYIIIIKIYITTGCNYVS
jgi:hypothetical protein